MTERRPLPDSAWDADTQKFYAKGGETPRPLPQFIPVYGVEAKRRRTVRTSRRFLWVLAVIASAVAWAALL